MSINELQYEISKFKRLSDINRQIYNYNMVSEFFRYAVLYKNKARRLEKMLNEIIQ